MKAIFIAAALLISGAAVTTASAAPAAPMNGVSQQGHVIDVQYRHRDRHDSRRHVRPAPRYRAGHRYRSAPRGWHRYHARPRDWNRRGCILVGPVWFCP
ncbi:MAG: hypothetical protein KIT48_12615 [Pseudolabrys sp.]|nr:hypothetical protein [Pseudolabrys sp.]